MGAARRDPRRGEIPVELISNQPFDDFPLACGVSRINDRQFIYTFEAQAQKMIDATSVFTKLSEPALFTYHEGGIDMDRKIRRGDMFYAALHPGTGSEQSGFRPIIVIQNNTGNKHSQTVIVAHITSRMFTKAKMPTHCPVKAQQGLGRDSLILLEQLRTIDKSRLKEYIGTLGIDDMNRIDKALAVSVGLLNNY